MIKDCNSKIAKSLVDTVTAPHFDRYSHNGPLYDEDDQPIEDTSVHLIFLENITCMAVYKGTTGELVVHCINKPQHPILTASYDSEKKSWTFEGIFTEDCFGSEVIHACRVLQRLHNLAVDKIPE